MSNRLLRVFITIIVTGIIASVIMAGALATTKTRNLETGALAMVDLDDSEVVYTFTPTSNSVYDIYLFPANENTPEISAQLWQGDQKLASSEDGWIISERLKANEIYTIMLSGSGRVQLEVARHALSRCFGQPMQLNSDQDKYSKAIARQGDVHWYAVTAESELPIVLAGVPAEPTLELRAQLFDADGRELAEAMQTVGGAFLMDYSPEIGQKYYIRIAATNGQTGLYHLYIYRSEFSALPDALTLSQKNILIDGRASYELTARVSPEDACEVLFWESSDPTVVRVSQTGAIEGNREGTAVVTAYAAGGIAAHCRVEVKKVSVTGVSMITERIDMNVGDDVALEVFLQPDNASDLRIEFEVEPLGIVEVAKGGILYAKAEGIAIVTVRTRDGDYMDSVQVVVGPAVKRYRALLVGEQNYASTVAAVRPGSANSVANIRSMLGELSYEGVKFQVSTILDGSRDGVVAGIRSAFAEATEQDISLFYITCHGYYEDGLTYLQMYDGSVLTAIELERELRKVPGTIVVMIDCCGSGGVLGSASSTENILDGVISVFDGNVGAAAVSGSKYKVLVSAALEQDSYRISFNEEAVETDMATVFARALCEAVGWNIDDVGRTAMRADVNYDSAITLNELFSYTSRRVMWYLDLAGSLSGNDNPYVQTVKTYPEGDTSVLFQR